MSNSPLVDYTLISPNKTSPRNHKIDTITIHCVVGKCTVESLGSVFAAEERQASANYGIGWDGRIGMYVEEKDRSWCSSNAANDNRAITIEVASETQPPYAVSDAAYNSLINLLVDICKRNDIDSLKWSNDMSLIGHVDKQNMTVHRWFAATDCPGQYLYSRMSQIAKAVNTKLNGEDEDKTFTENLEEYRDALRDNDASEYSKEAREWALRTGLIQGSGVTPTGEPNAMWGDFLTREQFVTVLYRYHTMNNKTE